MATKSAPTWQEELANELRRLRAPSPVFTIVSDRRGGRTAWSAIVIVSISSTSQNIAARYWYDGQYLNNAKEDASEVACTAIRKPVIVSGLSREERSYDSAREEEKLEAEEEPLPEGAVYKVGEEAAEILD